MTEQTNSLFSILVADHKRNEKLNLIFGIICIISLLLFVVGVVAEEGGLLVISGFVLVVFAFVFLFRWIYDLQRKSSLKNSLNIMEKTGSIRYVNEIISGQYVENNLECLSEHVYYIRGTLILGYDDIIDIRRINNDYYFVTITGKQLHVIAPKINKDTINYLLNTYDITSGADYKSYKHKIEKFKKENS